MKYILSYFFIMCNFFAFSQKNSVDEIKINDSAFLGFLEDRIIANYQSRLRSVGEVGICWIKIEISEENKVLGVSTSPGTNQIFASFLKEVIESTSGKWKFPKEFDEKENKTLIVPVWYVFQKDGGSKKIENNGEEILSFLSSSPEQTQKIIMFPKLEYVSPFISSWSPTFNASKQ